MSGFTVTATELKNKAEELRNYNNQFKTSVTNLENREGALQGMWEGEAKEAFHTAFQSDKAQMTNFFNAIEQYINKLEAAAAKYAQTEAANVEIARTRVYK